MMSDPPAANEGSDGAPEGASPASTPPADASTPAPAPTPDVSPAPAPEASAPPAPPAASEPAPSGDGGATFASKDGVFAWQTAGGDFDSDVTASATVADATPALVTFDISTAVQAWQSGTSNHGLLLRVGAGSAGTTSSTMIMPKASP